VEGALRALAVHDCHLLVAASGGLDSTVLVHVLVRLREPCGLKLSLAHVNHGLRGQASEDDAEAVAELASRLGLGFATERVEPMRLREGGSSRSRPTAQEAARSLRRSALERIRVRLGCARIATAHHADDQVETVLMRMLRGCGPDSLGGISEIAEGGRVIRPLLDVSRQEILDHARKHGITWREDVSNEDPKYTRNRLRTEVLPRLASFNPRLLRAIGDLAEAQRRDGDWIESLVAREADALFDRSRPGRLGIAAAGWCERPEGLARRLVVRALRERGAGREVSRAHVMRMLAFLREARPGRAIELPMRLELRRISDTWFYLQASCRR